MKSHNHRPIDPHSADAADAALLDLLTAPSPPLAKKAAFARRDAALDPLLIAAAAASGPHVTRNHYHHDFFPGVMMPQSEGSWDWSKWSADDASNWPEKPRLTYVSRQAPRRQRLQSLEGESGKENSHPRETVPLKTADNLPLSAKKRRPSIVSALPPSQAPLRAKPAAVSETLASSSSSTLPVHVKCMARTRIPTPHGSAFLHLYHNNRDNKEHLAIVIDPAQFTDPSASQPGVPSIRSRSLDAVWSENETEMDRITRGAYVGRLSPTSQRASDPSTDRPIKEEGPRLENLPAPLIRIHSECFTGETVGSMRCDCGEQLDEAIRLISQPITIPSLNSSPATIPGRGVVVYLRQEGRGIGLLSKICAYNLQDIGHDTVTANLMLGHKADERGYEIAGAILRDLGLGSDAESGGEGARVLTNNPDKVEALQKEGVHVVERVPMIPRSWQSRHRKAENAKMDTDPGVKVVTHEERIPGATLIGGNAVHGEDLDKYLRTKVLRMGHMLPLWMEEPDVPVMI